ncbi:acyltransferase family protein [Shewanella livingstonensis]|uniref:acyltransferase family protein n=2 Tax=Shewanella livingstonensis TaxID=150120 RepID=UPI0013E306AC|nr:acyltransferase [Shewanella livingstonensis]
MGENRKVIDKVDYSGRVDTLRGIACLFLVFFHLVGNTAATGLKLQTDSYYLIVNQVLENIRMPLFSFLGGIVFAMRPQTYNATELLYGKIKRLIIPLFFVGIPFLYIKSQSGLAHVESKIENFTDYFNVLWMSVGHFWFLQSMFLVFIVFCIFNLIRFDYKKNILFIFLFSILLSFIIPDDVSFFSISGFSFLFPYFLFGMICHFYKDRINGASEGKGLFSYFCYSVFFILMLLKFNFVVNGIEVDRISFFCMSLSMFSLIVLLMSIKKSTPLIFIGKLSFTIYLYHIFFIAFSRKILSIINYDNVELNIFFGLCVTVFFSWLLDAICKRYNLLWVFIGTYPKAYNKAKF